MGRLVGLIGLASHSHIIGLAHARGTVAGSTIQSSATATYLTDGSPVTVKSNTAAIRVNEVLDVAGQPGSTAKVATARGDAARALPFVVTNIGNGPERLVLALRSVLGGDSFDPACPSLVLDSNGNGLFDPTRDTPYVAGANNPELQADQSLVIFALCSIPDDVRDGDTGLVAIDVRAATGTGQPGTLIPKAGLDLTDALVGSTHGRATSQHGFILMDIGPELTKSQAVTDPSGGTNPLPGATITYTLSAKAKGEARDAVITDPIPVGTSFVAGSIQLDGTPLTDAADADGGYFTGQAVEVQLGALSVSPRTVSFKVRIEPQ